MDLKKQIESATKELTACTVTIDQWTKEANAYLAEARKRLGEEHLKAVRLQATIDTLKGLSK